MWRGPHFTGGLQNSPWRSQSPSPSPSPDSHAHFKLWPNFLWFFEFFFYFSEKITQFFRYLHSQILLYDCVFWQFSTPPGHLRGCGKLQNLQKIAPGGLWKWLIEKWPLTWFLTKWGFHCITLLLCLQMAPNASELNKYYPFWVRTHFGYF